MEITHLTAYDLARLIQERALTSIEVLEAYLSRIQEINPKLNAVITLDINGARQRAAEADAALERGELWGPLHGVPITIKDSFETAGIRTTSGSKALKNYIPARDADVVARLRQAGAVIMGKTNLPTFAAGLQTDNPVFGRTNNPWNLECTPGGSTGGGASAVAAGLSPLEIGSDIGGSIRIPAHFCGIYGLKPTGGRVLGRGHISSKLQITQNQPPALPSGWEALWQLPVFGPLARSVADLRLALQMIAEPGTPPLEQSPEKPLNELRIAWSDGFGSLPISRATQDVTRDLIAKLEAKGCQSKKISSPCDFEALWEVTGACIGCMDTVFQAPWVRMLRQGLGRIIPGRLAPHPVLRGFLQGIRMKPEEIKGVLLRRQRLSEGIEEFLDEWDVWALPVSPIPAFTHRPASKAIRVDGKPLSMLVASTALNTVFNMTGHPVVVIPAGFSPDGMPIGIQLVGKRWNEMALLSAAETIDRALGSYRRPGEVG